MCVHPGASVEVTHVSINVYKSLEATQLQGSTGVLVSSEHPRPG
jgi:hypothetical protein